MTYVNVTPLRKKKERKSFFFDELEHLLNLKNKKKMIKIFFFPLPQAVVHYCVIDGFVHTRNMYY